MARRVPGPVISATSISGSARLSKNAGASEASAQLPFGGGGGRSLKGFRGKAKTQQSRAEQSRAPLFGATEGGGERGGGADSAAEALAL